MTDLRTTYLGLDLRTPVVIAACSVSSYIDRIKQAEDAGAGALVVRSLFEEQLGEDSLSHEEELLVNSEAHPEATTYFPPVEHGGAMEHLMWVEKTRAEVDFPLIGSLNCTSSGNWARYAKDLVEAGCNALELNVYSVPSNPLVSGADIEAELIETVSSAIAAVKVPISVKISPFYTNVGNVVRQISEAGAKGVVLFNRFLQPDIDPDAMDLISEMPLSDVQEMRLPLRWTALLAGRTDADLALTTGVQTGKDLAKAILAGASVVQTASALIKHGIPYASSLIWQLEEWMREHGFESLSDFRGSLSATKVDDPFAFERAQYVKLLRSQR